MLISVLSERQTSNIETKFFFTDKDSGQISAIVTAFELTPSICIWHMKRAIRTKTLSLRREGRCTINESQYVALQNLVTEHYYYHPIFHDGLPFKELLEKTITELASILDKNSGGGLFEYLKKKLVQYCRFHVLGLS